MASALSFPQQQQQPQGLPIQTASSSSVDGALLSALAAYITTGPDARNTTEQEVHDLAADAISKPGGRAHLEALIQSESGVEHKVWKKHAPAHGTLKLTKTDITVHLGVDSLNLSFDATGFNVAKPASATLTSGTFYYNDFQQFGQGDATFKLHVKGLNLHVSIYRNQVYVGHFEFQNATFTFPPGGVELNGSIA
ncbi:uncharacterized protein FSUBG_8506 [Fusarium subglutinans]|uniref:Uncharacterized protein n=1 Tax=Gibberella subglutinans TaxID=42677 RepID=A0A8H5PJ82_GIBSU|nr:uncharacterized protein FSUBG_8506 [Fusarium subglutinans]KAF5597472.1 hypothetical protein FSUBG_8506 [Fusarium subglutinans]